MHTKTLLNILKYYIKGGGYPSSISFEGWNTDDWSRLMKLSTKQGVSAIVYDIISNNVDKDQIPRTIKLNWALQTEKIEKHIKAQYVQANHIATLWAEHGIKTIVLKGIGLSTCYPTPWLRECGDFDCYLFDDYQKGIDIVLSEGGTFLHKDYKHAQIRFKNLAIEVHKYFTSFRGEITKHKLENDLHSLVIEDSPSPIVNGASILTASPTFNACFLLYHTQFHFLFESVKLRHLLDWILYIKAEHEHIDWEYVASFCKTYKLIRFAEALNAIALHYFGVELHTFSISNESSYHDLIMNDILQDNEGVSNKSGWRRRFQLIKNTMKTRWKYELIDSSFFKETVKRTYYFIFSNDRLKTS